MCRMREPVPVPDQEDWCQEDVEGLRRSGPTGVANCDSRSLHILIEEILIVPYSLA